MLKSKILNEEEQENYLSDLKNWLIETKDAPLEEMAAFFERRLEVYEDVHLGHWEEEYRGFADYLPKTIETLLDLGAGTGLELTAIFERFPALKVTAVDLSSAMLSKLSEKFIQKNVEAIEADYFEYPFRSQSFDAAVSFETLHHFDAPKKSKIFRKIFDALKNGGVYLECDYIAVNVKEEQILRKECERRRNRLKIADGEMMHFDVPLTLEKEIGLLREAGFLSVETLYRNGSTAILRASK